LMDREDLPIGTRIRLIGPDVRNGLKGKMCTIVSPRDVLISWPSADTRLTIRMDEIGDSHLYYTLADTSDENIEIVEKPERPMRCLVKKKELSAHVRALRVLVDALKKGETRDEDEKLRCADAAVDKITEMLGLPNLTRGMCKEPIKEKDAPS
jgi:hypothetical protein